MKIGQFTDTFLPVVDGVGRVVSQYAMGLGELGEDCFVITPDQKQRPLINQPFHVVDYPSVVLPGLTHYRVGLPALSLNYRRRIAGIKLDIVHAHSPFFAGREAFRISQSQNIPLVSTFHSKYYDDLYQITHSKTLARLAIKNIVDFYSRCDQVWAVSHAAAGVLHSYGYRGDITVVENGTDPMEPDQTAVDRASQMFGLDHRPLLLFVGQMNWKKNIRRILETADVLKRQGRELQLVLAGQGPSIKEIQELASALKLDQNVIYAGHVSDPEILQGLYARADLFLFPSLYDTAGLVVSEAAAVGTPSLLAAGSSAAEAVQDGINALLAKDTTNAMAERVAWALDHPDELKKIGKSAQKTIPKPWKEIITQVVNRYEDLIVARRLGR